MNDQRYFELTSRSKDLSDEECNELLLLVIQRNQRNFGSYKHYPDSIIRNTILYIITPFVLFLLMIALLGD